jgi:hypothetical protein
MAAWDTGRRPRDGRLAKLAARLRYAPSAPQLGRGTRDALAFDLDQSTGAGHRPVRASLRRHVRCSRWCPYLRPPSTTPPIIPSAPFDGPSAMIWYDENVRHFGTC